MPGINRFCVMATLQAARAHLLGLNLEEAYSWGLNRAIFYAAAKRGFKGGSARTGEYGKAGRNQPASVRTGVFKLGDDSAFREIRGGKIYFTIGGKLQTEEDFRKQIVSRFGDRFPDAWREAIGLLGNYDRETLLSQSGFYSEVYKPNRDSLVEKWAGPFKDVAPLTKGNVARGSRGP